MQITIATRPAALLGAVLAVLAMSTTALAQESGMASPAPSPAPSSTPAAEGPTGAWDVIAYDPWGEGLVEPLDGTDLTVALLTGGRLEGVTGCGEYHGGYSVDGERIGLGIVSTGFGECATRLDEEGAAFSVALEMVATWQAGAGGLELLDEAGDVRVVLERPPFTDITGSWVAERYARANGDFARPLVDVPIILDLRADGSVTGSSGCRFLVGEYTREGTRVLLGPIEPIGPVCSGDARKQERRLFKLFGQIARWGRDAQGLTFNDAFGQPLLVLREQVETTESASPEAVASVDSRETED